MTLTEFLTARLDEDEEDAGRVLLDHGAGDLESLRDRVLAEVEAKRRIVALHEQWPVMVDAPPEMEVGDPTDLGSMTARMTQRVAWLTTQEYRKRFGDEPPTSPMLAALAEVYADHPDYDEAWRP